MILLNVCVCVYVCVWLRMSLPTILLGGHITILMDDTSLDINSDALGEGVVSSIDIIGRLRHYITSVSDYIIIHDIICTHTHTQCKTAIKHITENIHICD